MKRRLREEVFARRDALPSDFRQDASRIIADRVLALPELAAVQPVGAYWPMRSEVDPRPVAERLSRDGRVVALPQTRHPLLSWRSWRPGEKLVHGGFKVMEPGPDAPEVFPRLLLVPLCAFDRHGGRVGYGKGHFDRSIESLSARHPLVTVGVAFAVQEVDHVPMEPHDRVLDMIVTEVETIRPDKERA